MDVVRKSKDCHFLQNRCFIGSLDGTIISILKIFSLFVNVFCSMREEMSFNF